MKKGLVFVAMLSLLAFTGVLARPALAKQRPAPTSQTLVVGYPTQGTNIGSKGVYKGKIFVRVYPVGKSSQPPVAASELGPSMREVWTLPLGQYEVHYAIREGSNLTTFIINDVILRGDRPTSMSVEMNGDAKTTIIGGDMIAQEMADSIRALRSENSALKKELTELKDAVSKMKP